MPTRLKRNGLDYSFRLVWIKNIPFRKFLETGIPELMALGALAGYEGHTAKEVMEIVVNEVQKVTKNKLDFNRITNILHILSNLHHLQQVFEEVMLNISELIDERQDPFFMRGEKKGLEQGLEQGRHEYWLEKLKIIINLITQTDIGDSLIANIAGVEAGAVAKIRQTIADYPEDFRERLQEMDLPLLGQ